MKKSYKEECDRRFDAYIMLIIRNTYKRYMSKRRKELLELTLNEVIFDDVERIDTLQGDADLFFEEIFSPKKLELNVENKKLSRKIESLTSKEKLVIFLCVFREYKKSTVAQILGMHVDSVRRIYREALEKLRDNEGIR